MTTSEKLFLMLAEEKNFHRTAEKAYITQQCLSDHIRRMEESYGTALFTRRPRVELTAAGHAVERMLLQLRGLERGLENELAALENGASGVLRMGINHTRSGVIMPSLWRRYHARYPAVRMEVFTDETNVMQDLLLHGKIDLFLGVNAKISAPLVSRPLMDEGIYLVATEGFLLRHLGKTPERVSLASLRGLPLVTNHLQSTTWVLLERRAEQLGFALQPALRITDYGTLSAICRDGEYAFVCPQFFLSQLFEQNAVCMPEHRLHALAIDGLEGQLRFELISNGALQYPRYICALFDEIVQLTRTLEMVSLSESCAPQYKDS